MASLSNIKKRIATIQKTSKITQAMKLVSTVKIQRQKNEFVKISNFMDSLYKMLQDLARSSMYESVFTNTPKSEKKLYILMTSSLGLCGSFNVNVIKCLLNQLKNDDDIYVVGNRGVSYLKSRGYGKQIKGVFNFDSSDLNHLEFLPLTQTAIEGFKSGEYKEIHIVYTKYINSLNFKPTEFKVLPLERSLFYQKLIVEEINELNVKGKIIEFEPKRSEIINNLIPFMFSSLVVSCVVESKLCEFSSRRNAMETATDNANELINELKVKYNRERQNKITQEITEIISGVVE